MLGGTSQIASGPETVHAPVCPDYIKSNILGLLFPFPQFLISYVGSSFLSFVEISLLHFPFHDSYIAIGLYMIGNLHLVSCWHYLGAILRYLIEL